jgi:hypothetical protein
MESKREPVVLPLSILTGLQVLFAGLAGITALNGYPMVAAISAIGTLAVSAAQAGVMFWIRGQVTPVEDAYPQPQVARYGDTGADRGSTMLDDPGPL